MSDGGKAGVRAKAIALVVVALAWVVLDRWSKSYFDGIGVGEFVASLPGGLIDLRLVHNTGAAWGIFAGNTAALGVFSLVVVALLLGYFVYDAPHMNWMQVLGLALIVGGGVGNAIDRFTQGYVTDFFATTFIDFPVFNVADVGVTCGVVLLCAGFLLVWRSGSASEEHS